MPTPTDCRRCGRPYYGAAGLLCDECEREAKRPLDAATCSRSYFPGMDWTPTEVKRLRESATYEHAGCTASAMGWAIKYANIHELALRLVQAKGRFHTQKAFEDLREFISSENVQGDGSPDTQPNQTR